MRTHPFSKRGLQTRSLSLLLFVALTSLVALAQAPTAAKTATAAVSGRITDGETPIPGITVTARDSLIRNSAQSDLIGRAVTDSDGRYRLANLPAGRFKIVPHHVLYVVNERMAEFGEVGRAINLADGENVENADFTMTKGGVIAGRITDENGKAAVNQLIGLLRQAGSGKWEATSIRNFRIRYTDDLGDYRIYGLEAGRYKVFVGRAEKDGMICGGCGNNFRRQVFYPNANDEATAQVVEVKTGEVSANIDIRLGGLFKTLDVVAQVVDAQTGQPVAGAMCGYGRWNKEQKRLMGMMNGVISAANGEARFQGIAPGDYAAYINDGGDIYSRLTIFEVTETAAPNIEIKVQRGKSLSGQIVLLGTNESARALLRQTNFEAFANSSSEIGPTGRTFTPNADQTFQVAGMPPGEMSFSIAYNSRESGLRFIAVEHLGIKKVNGLTMPPQGNLNDVKLYVLAPGTSSLRGQVLAVNGTLLADTTFRLRLVPKNVAWMSILGDFGNIIPDGATSDPRGQFEFQRIYPGEYELQIRGPFPDIKQTIQINEGFNQTTIRVDLSVAPPRKEEQ